jgi:hypothetical protein
MATGHSHGRILGRGGFFGDWTHENRMEIDVLRQRNLNLRVRNMDYRKLIALRPFSLVGEIYLGKLHNLWQSNNTRHCSKISQSKLRCLEGTFLNAIKKFFL